MSVPFAPVTFSEALAKQVASPTKIDRVVAELGEVQGKLFMEALMNFDIKLMKLHQALSDVGIKVAQSTLGAYRREHGVK